MTYTPNTRLKYRAVGCNIYGGGFTLGLLKHFNILAQLEEINLGKKTFDLNFEKLWRPLDREVWLSRDFNSPELVYANPPCAPWSFANIGPGYTNDKRFSDKRLQLTQHTMELAQALKPQIFISESVENAYNIGKSHYHPFVEQWQALGYKVTWFLTDALLHGSPSKRRRFHFIAHKLRLDLEAGIPGLQPGFKPTTVRDAIGDLASPKTFGKYDKHTKRMFNNNLDKLLPICPVGGNMNRVIKNLDGYEGPRASFLVKRWGWDAPSGMMVGFDFVHPDGKRLISFREAMRLCSYPDDFTCHNAVEAVDTVLPIIGDYFGTVFKTALQRNQLVNDLELEIIDHRPLGLPHHLGKKYPPQKFPTKASSRSCKMSGTTFYIYVIFREDGVTPCYVGKGSGNRVLYHFRRGGKYTNKHLGRIIKKAGGELPFEIVLETTIEQDAFDEEIRLIALYGRRDLRTGTLTNFTNGGEGPSGMSPSKIAKIRASNLGQKRSAETRQRIREAQTGKKRGPQSDIHKGRIRQALVGRRHSDETKALIGRLGKGRTHTDETKLKMGVTRKGRTFSDEHKRKISEGRKGLLPPMTGKCHSDETKAKMSLSQKKVQEEKRARNAPA